ncbi:hypothetical protein ANO14919_098840 [Xylariales sp. No.14919]|nr:hypothetical protein ANO14919_098840 [Xylariales sp. No.14919]
MADERPTSSPFNAANKWVRLQFAGGTELSIPYRSIMGRRKLASLKQYNNEVLNLSPTPLSVGHVLVVYLISGAYQCLKPEESTPIEKAAAEAATAGQVLMFAREYELPRLQVLAREEIEKLGKQLSVVQILDALGGTITSVDDVWLQGYLKSLVQPFFKTPPATLDRKSDSPDGTTSIAGALLKTVIQLQRTCFPPRASLKDLTASYPEGQPAAASMRIESAIDAEHNPATIIEAAPEETDSDTASEEIERDKKRKRRN